MAGRELQGWQPDPFGVHEMRYFSVGQATKLVRDGRVDTYDEPPGDLASPDAASVAQAAAVGGEQTAGARAGLPAEAPASAAISALTTSMTSVPGQSAPTGVFSPLPANEVAAASAASRLVARPRRRWIEYGFVAAGAVVAVVVFVALEGGGSGKPGIAPAAFVTKAAQQTLAARTADFTLSSTASLSGQTVDITGSGQIDLANGSMSLNVGATAAGGSVTENAIEVGGNSYLRVTVNGHGLPLSGGRHWIETPFTATSAGSFASASPESSLALLSQQGSRVTALGTQSIGGQSCNGYSVTPSSQAMLAGARKAYARIGLSTAQANAGLQAMQNLQPPTIEVWFGTKTNLACQVSIQMQFGAPTSSGTGSGQVVAQLTFSHYGEPVNITAPPASDTVFLQQYLHGTAV